MDETFVTTGFIQAGKLRIRHRPDLLTWIRQRKDTEVVLTVSRRRATRNLAQNAYLWGVVYEYLSEHTGYTADELHEWAKMKFLPKRLALTDGNGEIREELVIGGTTTRLNKLEFGEYIDAIRRFAAEELMLVIPDPVN